MSLTAFGPAPRLRVVALDLFEQDVPFTKPFHFGSSIVTDAPQAFARAIVEVEDHGTMTGAAAEMMMPRWFDKRPNKSPADTVSDLRASLRTAQELYLNGAFRTAFGHHAAHYEAQVEDGHGRGVPALAACYGPALIDKAILDALLRALDLPFAEGVRRNVFGLDGSLAPDLDDGAIARFLASRSMSAAVDIRHTIGLDDDLDDLERTARSATLRWFKIKLGGDPEADAARLRRIDAILARLDARPGVTLDANEQYADIRAVNAVCDALERDGRLALLRAQLLFVEQPLPREKTFEAPLGETGARHAVIIDEADDRWDAFPRARSLGYRGVSAKSCKGLYKALANGARAALWSQAGSAFFLSAEDLTCQAGLAVQQDTALAAILGAEHVERNGHHFGPGFVDEADGDAFLAAHPDLYRRDGAAIRLQTEGGRLSTRSLGAPGFASRAAPDWSRLSPLRSAPDAEATKELAH